MGTRAIGEQPGTAVRSLLDNQEIAAALSSETDGVAIDRDDLDFPDCVKVAVSVSGDLDDAADELVFQGEHADDDGAGSPDTWADADDSDKVDTADATVTVTDSDAPGIVWAEWDLRGYKRHFRTYLDHDASTLDTATDVAIVGVFSGMSTIPQD